MPNILQPEHKLTILSTSINSRTFSKWDCFKIEETRTVVHMTENVRYCPFRAYLVHVDVVVVVTVINRFDEALELPYRTAVDHQNESHSDGVLHF